MKNSNFLNFNIIEVKGLKNHEMNKGNDLTWNLMFLHEKKNLGKPPLRQDHYSFDV